MSFFSLYDSFVPLIRENLRASLIDVAMNYSYHGEHVALLGSLLFLIPGIELYRKRENAAVMRFLNNLSEIVGGSASRAILEGTVSGFRERLNKDIVLREDMTVKLDKDWEDFYEFLLATAYQCVGPIAFECSKGISELDRARSRVMEVFGWIPQQ
jgi:hypothetical protein